MSQNELHIGRLVPFTKIQGESELNTLKRLFKKLGKEFPEDKYSFGEVEDFLYEADLYEKVFYYNSIIYLNENHQEFDDNYVEHMEKNKDGSFSYVMGFYNGGTCLTEMLEENINNLNK